MNTKLLIFLFLAVTLGIYHVFPYNSAIIESFYSNFLFNGVRTVFDYTLGFLPFPTVYLFLTVLLVFFVKFLLSIRTRWRSKKSYTRIVLFIIQRITLFISLILIAFYWLWGYNYKRVDFMTKNDLVKTEITEEWIFAELRNTHNQLTALSAEATDIKNGTIQNSPKVEKEIRKSLERVLSQCGYKPIGNVRVKKSTTVRSTVDMVDSRNLSPFVSEGHIDNGLHSLTKPFTMAHEMSHGYGITEESTCNFTAFLACVNSDSYEIKYSGYLGYFRYLLSACRRTNPEEYKSFINNELNVSIRRDLDNIYKELDKYPDIMPKIRNLIYNSYLKSHGISEGTINYGMMIQLGAAWSEKKGSYTTNL